MHTIDVDEGWLYDQLEGTLELEMDTIIELIIDGIKKSAVLESQVHGDDVSVIRISLTVPDVRGPLDPYWQPII